MHVIIPGSSPRQELHIRLAKFKIELARCRRAPRQSSTSVAYNEHRLRVAYDEVRHSLAPLETLLVVGAYYLL